MDVHELTVRWQKATENLKSGWEKLVARLYPTPADTKSLEIDPKPMRPVIDAQSGTTSA